MIKVLAVASATLFVLTALKWTMNTYVPNSSGEDGKLWNGI